MKSLLLVALVPSLAVAQIPAPDGTYTGCYLGKTGTLRVIKATESCSRSETLITWNQKGIQGPPGPKGQEGPMGVPGVNGVDGLPGIAGPAGSPGLIGPQGQVGPQGIPGPRGEKGDQGNQGVPGEAGPQGIQGIPGPTGPVTMYGGDRSLSQCMRNLRNPPLDEALVHFLCSPARITVSAGQKAWVSSTQQFSMPPGSVTLWASLCYRLAGSSDAPTKFDAGEWFNNTIQGTNMGYVLVPFTGWQYFPVAGTYDVGGCALGSDPWSTVVGGITSVMVF
jgi:hypothetical protein